LVESSNCNSPDSSSHSEAAGFVKEGVDHKVPDLEFGIVKERPASVNEKKNEEGRAKEGLAVQTGVRDG
jgi:hypothetical protein